MHKTVPELITAKAAETATSGAAAFRYSNATLHFISIKLRDWIQI
jgi:hypothetical protein